MTIINSGDFGTMGVFFDIIGAYFLAQGLIIKSSELTIVEASDYMDGNPYRLKSAIYQRIDAWTGFTFLLVGFLLQRTTYQAFDTKGPNDNLTLTLYVPLLMMLLAILITSRLKKKLAFKAIECSFNFKRRVSLELQTKSAMKTPEQLAEAAKFYGEVIGVKLRKHEPIEGYIDRVISAYHSK